MNQTNTSKRIPTQINEFRGDYAFLSNFYPAPVSYMGQTYANNEALFKRRKHSLRESNANSVFFGCIILLMQRNSAEILHYARTGKK